MSIGQLGTVPDSVSALVKQAQQEFEARYSRPAEFVVQAPGRVNLIGEHIDYNDGFVMPMAIERCVVIAASLKRDPPTREACLHTLNLDQTATIPVAGVLQPQANGWANYVSGVIAGFLDAKVTIPGFDAVIRSDVPLGGGLSSSAALEVATATLLEAITGHGLEPMEKTLLCQRAEQRFAGVPCGIMDQFSSVFGQVGELMLLDCRSHELVSVPFSSPDVTVLITNSNVHHALSEGQYALRRSQCDAALGKLKQHSWRDVRIEDVEAAQETLSAAQFRRARHVVSETARTIAAAEALRASDWAQVGELMYASHDSLRDDYEVSCRELDVLVELARELGESNGVIGSRMTGGGFGGCTVTLVKSDSVEHVRSTIATEYESKFGIVPHGFASRPARGAHVLMSPFAPRK